MSMTWMPSSTSTAAAPLVRAELAGESAVRQPVGDRLEALLDLLGEAGVVPRRRRAELPDDLRVRIQADVEPRGGDHPAGEPARSVAGQVQGYRRDVVGRHREFRQGRRPL